MLLSSLGKSAGGTEPSFEMGFVQKPIWTCLRNALGLLALLLLSGSNIRGAGVTIITHGFNGNVNDWIIPMAGQMVRYCGFPGTDYTCYEISVASDYSI